MLTVRPQPQWRHYLGTFLKSRRLPAQSVSQSVYEPGTSRAEVSASPPETAWLASGGRSTWQGPPPTHTHTSAYLLRRDALSVARPDGKNRLGAKSVQIIFKKYLRCTLQCCCCTVAIKFRHLSYRGTGFCVPSSKGRCPALQPVLHNAFCLLGTPQTLADQKKNVRVIDKL